MTEIAQPMAARLAALPFAPALWLYMWWVPNAARRLTRTWPRWLKVPLFGLLYAGGLAGILSAQMDLYTRMTGVRVLEDDNFFFGLLLAEILIGIVLGSWVAYRRQPGGQERPSK